MTNGETEIRDLYHRLLDAWNRHSARDFAACFADDANVVGFDGSPMNGRAEIEAQLAAIFADHVTAAYVSKVREVRFLTPDVAVLRGVVGMVPPGQHDLNADANAIQTLIAVHGGDGWRIAVFHNTPAAFHGRSQLREALTAELRELL